MHTSHGARCRTCVFIFTCMRCMRVHERFTGRQGPRGKPSTGGRERLPDAESIIKRRRDAQHPCSAHVQVSLYLGS